jgi:hypothetical protein
MADEEPFGQSARKAGVSSGVITGRFQRFEIRDCLC